MTRNFKISDILLHCLAVKAWLIDCFTNYKFASYEDLHFGALGKRSFGCRKSNTTLIAIIK